MTRLLLRRGGKPVQRVVDAAAGGGRWWRPAVYKLCIADDSW